MTIDPNFSSYVRFVINLVTLVFYIFIFSHWHAGELTWPELDNWQKIFSKSLSGAMVYITEWDKFVEQSIQLFRADPDSVILYLQLFLVS